MIPFKKIVICSDGTGNTTVKGRGTNVFKIFEAVQLHYKIMKRQIHAVEGEERPSDETDEHTQDEAATEDTPFQIAFYDDGVGTERNLLSKIMGNAFGWGLARNVKDLYLALVRTYNSGDELYMFGFSRGAYTIHVLAGFIFFCGIIDRNQKELQTDQQLRDAVDAAYKEFRKKKKQKIFSMFLKAKTEEELSEAFQMSETDTLRTLALKSERPPIKFIGIWDCVAALGFPLRIIANPLHYYLNRNYGDGLLWPNVENAKHALSIDDQRWTFHPILWDERLHGGSDEVRGVQPGDRRGERQDREPFGKVEQVWFAGVHSNVGGGYPKQGLSQETLSWIMETAEELGLKFSTEVRDRHIKMINPNDKIYDSRAGLGIFFRYKVRNIKDICAKSNAEPLIHFSVFKRLLYGTDGYAPINLPFSYEHRGGERVTTGAYRDRESSGSSRDGSWDGPDDRRGPSKPILWPSDDAKISWAINAKLGVQFVTNIFFWPALLFWITALLIFAFLQLLVLIHATFGMKILNFVDAIGTEVLGLFTKSSGILLVIGTVYLLLNMSTAYFADKFINSRASAFWIAKRKSAEKHFEEVPYFDTRQFQDWANNSR